MVYIYSDSEKHMVLKRYAYRVGAYNSFKVKDLNNDGKKELLLGSDAMLLEISSDCYKCLWFSTHLVANNVTSRSTNDGSISIIANGTPPYSYQWSNGGVTPSVSNLTIGRYSITTTDSLGCAVLDTINIVKSELNAEFFSKVEGCTVATKGMASVSVIKGKAPYIYSWSNSANSAKIINLTQGTYSVTVTDSNSCSLNHSFQILKDIVSCFVSQNNITCYGFENGSVYLNPNSGVAPYTYSWKTGQNTSSINNLSKSTYIYTITDSLGCKATDSITISEPSEMKIQTTTSPDNSTTAFGDGSANVNVIGGIAPYTMIWSDPFHQTTVTAINLLAATYFVTVTDQNGCNVSDKAVVSSTNGINEFGVLSKINIYPNPFIDKINIEVPQINSDIDIAISNISGQELIQYKIFDTQTTIDISRLESGVYYLKLIYKDNILVIKIIKE